MSSPAERFSATAAGYAATMAPSVRVMALEVVRRARLRPGERVLDIGTGTGSAAAAARGDGRDVTGIDAAAGMLEIARREVSGVAFAAMDFAALDFGDDAFDVVIACHALNFATDHAAALREWRRVTRAGGRLSLSVPGPLEASPHALYAEIYARYGVARSPRYPTADGLRGQATDAGWIEVTVEDDPTTAIGLPDDASFRLWREIGTRGALASGLTEAQHRSMTDEMLAVTPRDASGILRIPFGTLYLAAARSG
ncbi:MAG: methyltransferase domain-containing protein [Candidatus Limnocylindria bacterium]